MLKALKKINTKWDKHTQGIQGTVIYIVMGFLMAYMINMFIGSALQTDTPMVAVFSESMIPTLNKGDLVVVSGTDDNISIGDIIVFDVGSKDYPIIHRVHDIQKSGGFRTKGDNNPYEDPWVISNDNIHGKALFSIPYLGWIKVLFVEKLHLA